MTLVTINVGGTVFQAQRTTLQGVPNTRLSNDMLLAENFMSDKQHYFFDRDPQLFSYIINFYRTGELHLPSGVCSSSIKKELKFWMVPEDRVSECCWKELYQTNGDTKALKQLNDMFHNEFVDFNESTSNASRFARMRHRMWMFLEYPTSSLRARIWEVIYYSLVITSTLVYLLDSVDSLRVEDTNMKAKCNSLTGDNSSVLPREFFRGSKVEMKYVLTRPLPALSMLDLFLTLVFTAEFIARFMTCPRKCQFMKSILNISDLIFLVCKYPMSYTEDFTCFSSERILMLYAALKTIASIRLLRMFRIGRSCQGFKVMLLAMKASWNELCLMTGSVICVTVLFAAVVYMVEIKEGTFSNMLYASWWAMITMTTVGYGDIYPVTPFGRVIGAVCAVTGLVVLTLPIAVIGTNFAQYYSINRNRKMFVTERKEMFIMGKSQKGLIKSNKVEQIKVSKF